MSFGRTLAALRRDAEGAVALEFALVAPMLIAMLLGVLMIGLHMQAYNSVRSAAFDTERFTVVEYQRENRMLPAQIEQVAIAIASRSPYNLDDKQLDVCVEPEATGVSGATRYMVRLDYQPHAISGIFKLAPPTIHFDQSIIVPGDDVAEGTCGEGGDGAPA